MVLEGGWKNLNQNTLKRGKKQKTKKENENR